MNTEQRPQRTQIMTINEVAKYLGVHIMTVYRHAKNGKLPMFRVGGRWRAKKDHLDQFLINSSVAKVK